MRVLLAVFAWLAFCQPAAAQQREADIYFLSFGGPPDAPTYIALGDAANIAVSAEGYRQLRSWTYFTREGHAVIRSLMLVNEFDCAGGRYRMLQITGHSWDGGTDSFPTEAQWEPVTPATNGETLSAFACGDDMAVRNTRFRRLGNVDPDDTGARLLRLQ